MNFKDIPNKYRPVPFWSWNDKLNTEETEIQIEKMAQVGIGGFFMHARGGLQTEYMGKDWFDNVQCGIDKGKELGLHPWAYDENGWPSGFGSGKVNGKGIKYQQKYLRVEKGEKHTEKTICNTGGYHFYYDVNPFYVDLLDKAVVREFISEIYNPYYEKFGNDLVGFFTDEPQLSRDGIPWSFVLKDEYEKEYGEDLLPLLTDLFFDTDTSKNTRVKFWRLVTKLFSESFLGQVYKWCDERGLKLTGHMVLEESLNSQLTTNGAVMPQYEYFHIPGMDWLGRGKVCKTDMIQLSSVAAQLGKKQVLSETFALTGWNMGFEEMRKLYEQQMVRGVNLLCTHLCAYSLRGIRKRDFPGSFFYHQPWWGKYNSFIDYVSRIGMLLAEGEIRYDTLLIHPQTTAWSLFNCSDNNGLDELNDRLYNAIDVLEKKHILFHFGDELLMEKYAKTENGKIIIGEQKYSKVILLSDLKLFDSTVSLIEEFEKSGGKIYTPENILPDDIIGNENIVYTKRYFDEFDLYYLVNTGENTEKLNIKKGTAVLDSLTGDIRSLGNEILSPGESIVVLDGLYSEGEIKKKRESKEIELDGEWNIKECDLNAYTLDCCDYYFDKRLVEKNSPVISIQEKACALKRKVNILMEFSFKADYIPKTVFLVCETPEIFRISVNGKPLEANVCGTYFDNAFKKISLEGYIVNGENKITMECDFVQSDRVYKEIDDAVKFEAVKNKLSYDIEIESIYLVGDFSIRTPQNFEDLERDAVRYSGEMIVSSPVRKVFIDSIEKQGFPFFSGKMVLSKNIICEKIPYILKFSKKFANIVSVKVNGNEVSDILWKPYEADISDYIADGENEIEIMLTGSLRNLLGPHHLESGESYNVTPASFFKGDTLWGDWHKEKWNDGYSFVKFGIEK